MAAAPPPAQPPAEAPHQGERKVGASGSVYLLKGMASIMLIFSFVIYFGLIADPDAGTWAIGLGILGAGLGIGIVGVWIGNIKLSKSMEYMTLDLVMLAMAVILLVIGAVLSGSRIDTGHSIPIVEILFVVLYGFFTLSYIEFAHASHRFAEIDSYARSHELKGFNVSVVVNNYFMWYGVLMLIILVMTDLILTTHYGILLMASSTNEVFGASVELNSIYVFAIAVAIWFVPLGIFAAIIFGEGSLISSTRTILIKSEKAPGEELLGLQELEAPPEEAAL